MPVLINKTSGAAENIADADKALASGEYELPIVDPQGQLGSAPLANAQDLLTQGYKQPQASQLQKLLDETKYSSTSQQVIGALEQVGRGALPFGLSTAAEVGLGMDPKDIRKRDEQTSTAGKMLGQGAGLVGSMLIPGGQAKVLTQAGKAGAALLGLGEASTLAKVGTAAAAAAIENTIYEGGSELHKVVLKDPDQTASSAVMNIGLSGLIGAGIGGAATGIVSPLWSATVGPKAENFLRSIANRANGETLPLGQDLASVLESIEAKGVKIAPEIRAGLSEDPAASNHFRQLLESGTGTGEALRETLDKFKGDVAEQLASVFKKEESLSAHEAGEKAKEFILNKANDLNEAISTKYAEVMPHLENIAVSPEAKAVFSEELARVGKEFGSVGSAAEGLFKTYGERIVAQNTIGQLKKLGTEIGSEWSVARRAGDFEKARALSELRSSLKEFQDNQIIASGKALEKEGVAGAGDLGKQLVADKKIADKAYGEFMDTIGEISSVGKLGKVKSHGQLLEALDKVPAAKLADKLFDKKNVEGLQFLQKNFPEVFETILSAKKSAIFEAATKTGDLKHTSILNSVNGIPKEVRNMMFSKEEQAAINASGRILRESNKRMNPSGTSRTWDAAQRHMPAGVGALASMILGHGAFAGAMAGEAARLLGRDVPDAAKMSLLKFLGNSGPIDGTAWKAMGDYISSAIKGEALLVNATKAAIKAGQQVLPKSMVPTEKSRQKLDKKLKDLSVDNSPMLDVGGKVSHYMPDHAASIAGISMNAVNYLNGLRPKPQKLSVFDQEMEPNKVEKYEFDKALDIAQQPLILMEHIQKGTLVPSDIKHLNALYPSAYRRMMLGLTEALVNRTSKDEPIDYKQRIGVSLFMAQPLDSTMAPTAIMATQAAQASMPQQTQGDQVRKEPSQVTQKAMSNLAKGNATQGQQREMSKIGTA